MALTKQTFRNDEMNISLESILIIKIISGSLEKIWLGNLVIKILTKQFDIMLMEFSIPSTLYRIAWSNIFLYYTINGYISHVDHI